MRGLPAQAEEARAPGGPRGELLIPVIPSVVIRNGGQAGDGSVSGMIGEGQPDFPRRMALSLNLALLPADPRAPQHVGASGPLAVQEASFSHETAELPPGELGAGPTFRAPSISRDGWEPYGKLLSEETVLLAPRNDRL